MPYNRKYRRKGRWRPKVSALKKWRKRLKKPRGSSNTRQTLANAAAIKRLRTAPELKFTNQQEATANNGFCGQFMTSQYVDNYGMPQSTLDWAAAPSTTTALLPVKYSNVILRPCYSRQTKSKPNYAGTPAPAAVVETGIGENQRIGNDLTLSHITLKGIVQGSNAGANIGNLNGIRLRQHLTMLVVLDREPVPYQLATPQTFNLLNTPAQLYQLTPDNPFNIVGPATQDQLTPLRSLPQADMNPPGPKLINSGEGHDLEAMSYYSKDDVLGPSGRFKILHKKTITVMQQRTLPSVGENDAASSNKSFSYTLKAPYKLHYNSDIDVLPNNQEILVFFYSQCPTIRTVAGVVPVHGAQGPSVVCVSRFSWRDE